ncbi:UNVERIFIED_CONTAM: hypothetical protein RMT77_000441 [Armadillidium vulgare]
MAYSETDEIVQEHWSFEKRKYKVTTSVVTDHLWQQKKFICCKPVDSSGRNKCISLAARLVRGW